MILVKILPVCYLFTCCTYLNLITITKATTNHLDRASLNHLSSQREVLPGFDRTQVGSDTSKASQQPRDTRASIPLQQQQQEQATSAVAAEPAYKRPNNEANTEQQEHNLSLPRHDGAPNTNGDNEEKKAKEEEKEKELKQHDVHKLMSKKDLRRTFQVDSHDQVPEYEILKLTVNDDGSHLISPISDLGELTAAPLYYNKQSKRSDTSTATIRHKRSSEASAPPAGSGPKEPEAERRPSASELGKGARKAEPAERVKEEGRGRGGQSGEEEEDNNEDDDKLIVMKLSTFGKDFKLRLKRNADFQQRIRDMKMFMAESTKDGQLRYTEIKALSSAAAAAAATVAAASVADRQKQPEEPHKRSSTTTRAAESSAPDPTAKRSRASDRSGAGAGAEQEPSSDPLQAKPGASSQERAQEQQKSQVWNIGSTYHDEDNLAALLIDHDKRTGQLLVDGTIGNDFVIKPMPQATLNALGLVKQRQQLSQQAEAALLARQKVAKNDTSRLADHNGLAGNAKAASEPKQDDANAKVDLEQLKRADEGNRSSKWTHLHDDDPHDDDEMFLDEDEAMELAQLGPSANRTRPTASGDPSAGKAERKWKKYRKLKAQTQVPKLAAPTSGRARRARQVQVSHHIVYRQRPSSESSSGEHQHSFMISPGEMEQMASSFASRRLLTKRQLGRNELAESAEPEADHEPDPFGGQFELEPALERLDWSLLANRRQGPPYALNATEELATNRTGRFKRSARRPQLNQVRRKRQAPDTVWPEVLLVVDYDSFLLHGGDSRDVKRYFVSFWNGVDLRYKLLVHPHIRISLAGMIVAKDRDATPYLERNRLRAPNADAVDAAGALTDMGKYLYREDRLPTYDLAVVITKLDMCRRRYEGGRCNRGTAGFAYVGGACVVNKRLEKVNSVAIIEDSGGFSGIIVAAHEVGHLLGCVHDGSPPPSYLGGPGATHCPWEDGFIMSDLRHTERGFRWSQCSVEQFKHFLNGETATCLYNYPHESQMLHRLLPGTMLSLDEQCKRDRGTNACFKDARVCAQLFCFDSASGYCVSYRPAAEGSPCGEGQVCRNGKCVGEIENIIPDYTHQRQTIVPARRASIGSVAHGRVADNGLSASSTSTATSSPDYRTLPVSSPV